MKYTAYIIKDKCTGHLWALYWLYIMYRYFYAHNIVLPSQLFEVVLSSISRSGNGDSETSSNLPRETKPGTQSRLSESTLRAPLTGIQLLSSFRSICLGPYSKGRNVQTNCLALHHFSPRQAVDELNFLLFTWLFCHLRHTSTLWLRMKNVFHKTV